MSTSSPVRNRQSRRPSRPPQAGSEQSPRDATVVARSILMVVAAVSVLATSNYFAYLIGRKQVTYEELRRQVDLVVQFMDQKRVEPTTLKQRHSIPTGSAIRGLAFSPDGTSVLGVVDGQKGIAVWPVE